MFFPLSPALYYLANFHRALEWLGRHHLDLMDDAERDFLRRFPALPLPAQALLVRMVMRKGPHFRAGKLRYAELGCPLRAAEALLGAGWVSREALLTVAEVAGLMRREELLQHFGSHLPRPPRSKALLTATLAEALPGSRPFADWCPAATEVVLSLTVAGLCERLRLMFFGNLAQDWSEFVLADLGIFRYETVEMAPGARGFRSRAEVEAHLHLYRCRERLAAGEAVAALWPELGPRPVDSPHLARRHGRLALALGRQLEREGELEQALALYREAGGEGSRVRRIRVLERLERHAQAHALALEAMAAPESGAEAQLAARALQRLSPRLGLGRLPRAPRAEEVRIPLRLPRAAGRVEEAVRAHFHTAEAPVFYVENTLICSLFGLLCWEAIFAPVPGAFFHPFQAAPADLHDGAFRQRRAALFDACLARLADGSYRDAIRHNFAAKQGMQSPFVFWSMLTEELLELALACLPSAHLRACFERLLLDLRENRAGMPDLIQFWPAQQRYRMLEVKGPGDRLQDNQKRWLAFCAEQGMPVAVCYLSWEGEGGEAEA